MTKSLIFASSLFLGVFAFGCSASPEKVCKKFFELAKKDADDDDKKKKKKDDDDGEEKAMKACVKEMEKIKEKEPEAFKCFASCVSDASSFKEGMKCKSKCKDKVKDKDKDDDDDGDKKDKKKKSKDDDDK